MFLCNVSKYVSTLHLGPSFQTSIRYSYYFVGACLPFLLFTLKGRVFHYNAHTNAYKIQEEQEDIMFPL